MSHHIIQCRKNDLPRDEWYDFAVTTNGLRDARNLVEEKEEEFPEYSCRIVRLIET